MIQRIAIVGGNGSGKTTLGKALAGLLGWKAMDVEDYYFKPSSIPYAAPRTKEEVMQLLLADMKAHKQFVFSSVNCDYGPEINRLYDCVIYLQVSKEIRLARVKQRAVDMFDNRVLDGGGHVCTRTTVLSVCCLTYTGQNRCMGKHAYLPGHLSGRNPACFRKYRHCHPFFA